ncbi:MAG: acyltransferase [Thermoleophilia bacterium]|nr:acyltransferase [Thermoleophilia bacterium]
MPAPPDSNSLWVWRKWVPLRRVALNFVVIYLCRYLPFLSWKNFLYRALGARIGNQVSFGLGSVLDIFFPQLITVGDNSIIGYNTVILAHEFLVDELRVGPVTIGQRVMIGANVTILPGVKIGDRAVISACSLVNADVAPGSFVGGVPARPISSERVAWRDAPTRHNCHN